MKKIQKEKQERFELLISTDLLNKIQEEAKNNEVTVSAMMRLILKSYFKNK